MSIEKSRNLMQVNDDNILEIVRTVDVKERLSENSLTKQKEILEGGIIKFQAQLNEVNSKLAQIEDEKNN